MGAVKFEYLSTVSDHHIIDIVMIQLKEVMRGRKVCIECDVDCPDTRQTYTVDNQIAFRCKLYDDVRMIRNLVSVRTLN